MTADIPASVDQPSAFVSDVGQEAPSERALGDVGISPVASAAVVTQLFSKGSFGELPFDGLLAALIDHADRAERGDLTDQRSMLASQSMTLNAMFAELARRAAENMAEHPRAMELYMRLALRAQAQSRATVEALDRMVNGREQTVRHVHVDNRGGQAVIAENVHTGGLENEEARKQPHAIPSDQQLRDTTLRRKDEDRKPMPIKRDG